MIFYSLCKVCVGGVLAELLLQCSSTLVCFPIHSPQTCVCVCVSLCLMLLTTWAVPSCSQPRAGPVRGGRALSWQWLSLGSCPRRKRKICSVVRLESVERSREFQPTWQPRRLRRNSYTGFSPRFFFFFLLPLHCGWSTETNWPTV